MREAKKSSRSAVALRKSQATQPRYCDCGLRADTLLGLEPKRGVGNAATGSTS